LSIIDQSHALTNVHRDNDFTGSRAPSQTFFFPPEEIPKQKLPLSPFTLFGQSTAFMASYSATITVNRPDTAAEFVVTYYSALIYTIIHPRRCVSPHPNPVSAVPMRDHDPHMLALPS
jgi:hypothetical protein